MTISTTVTKSTHLGNGVTTEFPTQFPFLDPQEVKAATTDDSGLQVNLVYGVDYVITGGLGETGTATLTVAPASGITLVLYRETARTQETDYGSGDAFPAASHERALDKLTMEVQEMQEQIDRTLKVSITNPIDPDQLITDLFTAAAEAEMQADRAEDEANRAENEANRAGNEANRSGDEADRAAQAAVLAADIVETAREMFVTVPWNGPIESIPVGLLPISGVKWYAATYPDAAQALEDGKQFAVPESDWQNGLPGNPDAYKGCWSLGGTDANGRWYRTPKWNRDGVYRAPFLRGSEIGVDAGVMTDDRIRNITAQWATVSQSAPEGAVVQEGDVVNGTWTTTLSHYRNLKFDASLSVGADHVGPENSPRYHGVIMCVRMFGTVSNPGSVDAAQLATDLAVANAKIAALESNPKIIGSGDAPYYGARAWVNFDGTGVVSIRSSGNVTSITDVGTGGYILNFEKPMPSLDFCLTGTLGHSVSTGWLIDGQIKTLNSARISTVNTSGAVQDTQAVNVVVFC